MNQLIIAGVDEVGRGPLAGPVVAAAVILDEKHPIIGIADSKTLSPKKRRLLANEIRAHAIAYAFGRAEVDEIDTINIFHASLLAMQRAVLQLPIIPDKVQVDGKFCPILPYPTQAIIGGDKTVLAIGAASIIAKVARDEEMCELEILYPGYGFAQHKGYPTAMHLTALKKLGASSIHRRSFKPVQACLNMSSM